MSIVKREFVPGNYYHIYNRGAGKQKIFLDDRDKDRFTQLLYLCNGQFPFRYNELNIKEVLGFTFDRGESLVEVCSWVLMDNHFHLLLFLPTEKSSENISQFVSRLSSSYLKYFNEKHNRTGALMEGRYQSVTVSDDLHLKYLYSYIHLNPLKIIDEKWKENLVNSKKHRNFLQHYKYSSYQDLVVKQKRSEFRILSKNLKVLEISQLANNFDNLKSLFHPDPRGS
jgi:putative transposase